MKYLMSIVLVMFALSASAQDIEPNQNTNKLLPPSEPQVQNMLTLFVRQPCKSYPEMKKLLEGYGETLLFTATYNHVFQAQDGRPFSGGMMFFVNQEDTTYTVLNVYSDGMACMVNNGRGFAPYSGD